MECEACEMAAFELRADYADLDLDGRHWSELFGGWRGASALGGYVCFNAGTFVVVRHVFAAIAFVAWVLQLVYRYEESASVGYYMTELQHWTVLFTFVYLALAAFLSTVAVRGQGGLARRTPGMVLLCVALYGAVLPLSFVNLLAYWMVILTTYPAIHFSTYVATIAPASLMLLDLWINRQPYYAGFHALIGTATCWAYVGFTAIYWAAGGRDRAGHKYIYPQLDWSAYSSGKTVLLIILLVFPLFNVFYWFLIWARRRVLVALKPPGLSV